jgi:hypothetical protein
MHLVPHRGCRGTGDTSRKGNAAAPPSLRHGRGFHPARRASAKFAARHPVAHWAWRKAGKPATKWAGRKAWAGTKWGGRQTGRALAALGRLIAAGAARLFGAAVDFASSRMDGN